MNNRPRYPLIDLIRFAAIFLMVIFHFAYDMNLFGWAKINFDKDLFWWGLPRVIVFLFLFAMGLSLPLVHLKQFQKKKFLKRFLQITISAIAISISTYLLFPTRWVYFGTLHCVAICSVMALPFLKRPHISLLIALPMLLLSIFFKLDIPWVKLDHLSMDYIPVFPWFGIVLLAIFCYHKGFHAKYQNLKLPKIIRITSKHALIIYLLHQPLLYGTMFLIFKLM